MQLLDIVGDVEPLGAIHWTMVGSRYAEWAAANGVQPRDDAMVKQMFDRLATTKKSTGDPTCPDEVRRAKRISRQILNKAQAVTLGGASDSEHDDT